jgi:5-methylcytosine-specific restriction endonuclease McrA
MNIEKVSIDSLIPDPSNARKPRMKMVSVTCTVCGDVRLARSDYAKRPGLKYCRPCATRIGGQSPNPTRRTGSWINCAHCTKDVYKRPSDGKNARFCSSFCANEAKRVYLKYEKECNQCKKIFKTNDRPKSNSPSNYCSIKCRNDSYHENAIRYGFSGHRSRWRSKRNAFISKNNNFCFHCGIDNKRLYVHHINPYRSSFDDSENNLITLCSKCHSKHEIFSNLIEKMPEQKKETAVAIVQAHMGDKWHYFQGLKIQNERVIS